LADAVSGIFLNPNFERVAAWNHKGNVAFGDGSVATIKDARLRQVFADSGLQNKLALSH